ncbi:M23 family metallopeptidase [Agrococcus sp. 1P02AA]|uniref:M23 family metallopeptidase n=1 Tax=Agrococcus sp. 1P02AA TaxID=3132259 RepID=UPI0039A6E399
MTPDLEGSTGAPIETTLQPHAPQFQTRSALREYERTVARIARTTGEVRASARHTVAEGSPPIYTSRREMREAATRAAHALPVQIAEPTHMFPRFIVDAPSFGTAGERVPSTRPARPIAPRPALKSPSSRPSTTVRRARDVVQKVTAGAALLFIGSLVVVTSLPAQAVQSPSELDLEVAQLEAAVQSLDSVTGDATTLFTRDEIVVNDPLETALMSPDELAAFQAVADSERGGSYYGGAPAFPSAWAMLETDYVQTPFPQISQMPISSSFGYRAGGFHGGTDLPLPPGQEVRPIANGVVSAVWQGNNPGGGGYAVFVDHNIGGRFVQSWYPHLQAGSIRVEVGQVVDISTVVGQVGSTGRSTGPHLHLELKNSDYVSFDPILWLQSRETRLETG